MSDNFNKPKPPRCSSSTYQFATVSLPITVKPSVNTGETKTFCCGEPSITPTQCTFKCSGSGKESCSFILSQHICIEVPIEFGAVACVGEPCVECGHVTGKNLCQDR